MGAGIPGPDLAAAVSNAGGLGTLGVGALPGSFIGEQIRRTRALTSQPFLANLIIAILQGDELAACFDDRLPILGLFGGDPRPFVAEAPAADGRGLVAALALGTLALSMGTRFLASDEAAASPLYKELITRSRGEDTVLTRPFDIGWPGAPHRVLRNRVVAEWEDAGGPSLGDAPASRVRR
jgi:NAD(P)H-dependent flavin oxidoreductase YrpB (nitropropane dioxygenase family)